MNSESQRRIFLFIERLWLAGAGIGVIFTVYFLVTGDNDSALFFFGFFILSAVLHLVRKHQRKKQDAYLASRKK